MKDEGDFVELAKVRNWSFTYSQEVLDATTLGDTDRTLVDGVRSGTGTASLFYYNPEASPEDDRGAGRLLKKILKPRSGWDPSWNPNKSSGSRGDTSVRSYQTAFRLQANNDLSRVNNDYDNSDSKFVWVTAWITSFQMTMSVGEILSCEISFECDGAPLDNKFSVYGTSDL